jgi:hypothetical protein
VLPNHHQSALSRPQKAHGQNEREIQILSVAPRNPFSQEMQKSEQVLKVPNLQEETCTINILSSAEQEMKTAGDAGGP